MVTNVSMVLNKIEKEEEAKEKRLKKIEREVQKSKKRVEEAVSGLSFIL